MKQWLNERNNRERQNLQLCLFLFHYSDNAICVNGLPLYLIALMSPILLVTMMIMPLQFKVQKEVLLGTSVSIE